jgi:hypothetical protein
MNLNNFFQRWITAPLGMTAPEAVTGVVLLIG